MRVDISIEGVSKTVMKFKLLNEAVRGMALDGMKRSGNIIEARAKENISGMHGHGRHVKTGNLRRSIQTKAGWKGFAEVVAVIGTDVPYAPHIEALPDGGFLYPALMEVGKQALGYFKAQLVLAVKAV